MHSSDTELLQRFAATGDQAAFTALVSRHAGMVRGTAWRRTQDWPLAEEVAQNVFSILARKAGALRHEGLAGWLHRAAVLESVNAVRKAAHYRKTLHLLSGTMNETGSDFPAASPSTPDPGSAGIASATTETVAAGVWEELRPHLDEAMARLPSEARHLVVLRYLEHRPLAEVAAATGKNAEACRKRLQRSLRQLETLLRRRGISPASLLSLAAVLGAQPLCAPPASAATLAAAALKAAPALKLSVSTTLTLHLMKTGSITKTAAITLALAAIPITLLWRDNAGLRTANHELLLQVETAAAHTGEKAASAAADRKRPGAARNSTPSGKPDTASSGITQASDEAEAAARKREEIRQNGRNKALRLAETEFTRLTLNVPGLTPDQKTKIREALEAKSLATIDGILQAFESGAVASAVKNPESLTAEEKTALSRMANVDPRKAGPPVIDEELKAILTPDQYAVHAQAQESRRVTAAEESAGDAIKFISRTFDLTADQKDRIFQQLAQLALAPEEKAPAATGADPFPEIGSREAARDRIIRAHLTPEQADVFDQKRAAEREVLRQQMMEFYDRSKPEKPAAATAGGSGVSGG